ncbi:MAG TPA: SpoIID/LytB domain-containing protein, partial [Pyrinomonadaceae bacterium]|nr:SpoIID/LytB domain-containing protein [Pyrinomonadaceae bacterium]
MTASLLSPTLDRRSVSSKLILCALITTTAILSFNFAHKANWSGHMPGTDLHASEEQLDRSLSVAAVTALGKREGTVIVMDPQSGRIRAVVGSEYAFGAAFAPGSTIKPFTTLAALRDGLITKDSRILCREHYVHEDFETVCSHPTALPPLRPTEAIAYSCNYYFGKLGEQLRQSSFNSTLAEFGFGRQTGINWSSDEKEAAGRVAGTKWRSENALGESDQILVTPIQLLTAYSALLNGGHLMTPRIAPEKDFVPQERLQLQIEDQQRQLIIEGMRGSVRYGTAERARLHSLPLYVLGKTGTSTQTRGFRTQGWFVGIVSTPDKNAEQNHSKPEIMTLAVLVFLKRGHGSDAAELARPVLEAYAREMGGREDTVTRRHGDREMSGRGDTETGGHGDVSPSADLSAPPRLRVSSSVVRVHLVNENTTRTMTLEDYILGVVAAEGSTENEPEALKALAVAARTYALKNPHRHRNEGYDFCTTTHCQRYRHINSANAGAQVSSEVVAIVKQTMGEALYSSDGQVVDSYFSASCGGARANISTLWSVKASPHLMGGPDEYCLTMPHHSWTDVISAADLHRALRSDPRTNVGNRLSNVIVTRYDRSGRAESILIDGERRQVASGWDFKIVVGRALGWNLLKSSRFEIKRSGSVYVFRGSGFGHGLGLCQEGAHVMARRGAGYKQILSKYFPGITVARKTRDKREKGRSGEEVMGRRGQNGVDLRGDGPNLDGFLSRRPISSSS